MNIENASDLHSVHFKAIETIHTSSQGMLHLVQTGGLLFFYWSDVINNLLCFLNNPDLRRQRLYLSYQQSRL